MAVVPIARATPHAQIPRFDAGLIRRYDTSGPRYTSYPTAVQFHEAFGAGDYRAMARAGNEDPIPRRLSLYFHIPFCSTLCFYCACNKIVTRNRGKAVAYLARLYEEVRMQGNLYDMDRPVVQLHLGGGTPTFLSADQIQDLIEHVASHFSLSDAGDRDYSIEVDPRTVDASTLRRLRSIGFNRISMGVQDFDARVQRAVHREQPEEETIALIEAARACGFQSVNIDLIYGLPFQSVESFDRTLATVIEEADPDRLCIFNYAHLPHVFAPQRRINAEDLPPAEEKLKILELSVNRLTQAGYRYIGMDHFAKPDDELAVARGNGSLYRNFQGYSSHAECDLVGMGVTAISQVGDCYAQNVRTLDDYYDKLDRGLLPVSRGVTLDADDRLRGKLIEQLMCYGEIDLSWMSDRFRIDFRRYFAPEMDTLQQMRADGLVHIGSRHIRVTPAGWLLIRNVCMVFDAYLRRERSDVRRFSRVL